MKGNVASDFIFWTMVVGGTLVLTRPGSQGPGLVKALTSGYTGIVQGTTGQNVTA